MRSRVADLRIELRAVAALIPYIRNAKQHSDSQVAQIAGSIVEFGWGAPILVDGRIYFFDCRGKATVIAATPEFKVLATNQLDDGCMASPAVVGKSLIVRTKKNLYRID